MSNIVELVAKSLCKTWPKVPDGCAALCMNRLGGIPKEGCSHALAVHGERAKAVLAVAYAEAAKKVDEFSWTLPMFVGAELNSATDNAAEDVRQQIATMIRSLP